MNKNDIEIRTLPGQDVQLRKAFDGKNYIEGYGIVFNKWSQDLGGFIERIAPEAIKGQSWEGTIGTRNHNNDVILGKVPKTMEIKSDTHGVFYSIETPDNTAGRDTLVSIGRGDISGSSFTFTIPEDGETWEKPDKRGEPYRRTITRMKVYEMGPVVSPAYLQTDTSVAKRALGKLRDEEEKNTNDYLEKQKREQEAIEKQHADLEAKFNKMTELLKLQNNE